MLSRKSEDDPLDYELERIFVKQNPVQGLGKLRDTFIIQCFTGFASYDL